MDVINPEYPRGNKFYKVEKEQLQERAAGIFTSKMYHSVEHIRANTLSYNETLGSESVSSWANSLIIDGEHSKFPKFQILYPRAFQGIDPSVTATILQRKANYQSMSRFKEISNMPWTVGMIVQWDDARKGFIVYDTPYEGLLDIVPKSGISKAITIQLNDIVAETGMFELLGESLYVQSSYGNTSINNDLKVKNAFEAILSGTQTTEQTTDIAQITGAYEAEFDTEECIRLRSLPGNKYYKLVRKPKVTPKISTVTRQALLYKYGGTKLPENWLEWFDG
jgi:hypothetical protein